MVTKQIFPDEERCVFPPKLEINYIPCIPKFGSNSTISRLNTGTWLKFCGIVDLGNEQLMHFKTDDEDEVLISVSCLPFLRKMHRKSHSKPKFPIIGKGKPRIRKKSI